MSQVPGACELSGKSESEVKERINSVKPAAKVVVVSNAESKSLTPTKAKPDSGVGSVACDEPWFQVPEDREKLHGAMKMLTAEEYRAEFMSTVAENKASVVPDVPVRGVAEVQVSAAAAVDDAIEDPIGLDTDDIDTVALQTNVTRSVAIRALRKCGNIIDAIVSLS